MLPFGKAVMKRVGAYVEAELSSVSDPHHSKDSSLGHHDLAAGHVVSVDVVVVPRKIH